MKLSSIFFVLILSHFSVALARPEIKVLGDSDANPIDYSQTLTALHGENAERFVRDLSLATSGYVPATVSEFQRAELSIRNLENGKDQGPLILKFGEQEEKQVDADISAQIFKLAKIDAGKNISVITVACQEVIPAGFTNEQSAYCRVSEPSGLE